MTQDNHNEKRRKHMAAMDDKKGTQTMTAPELKRYVPIETPDGLFGNVDMAESASGKYVRLADVEACTKAAIDAAMMGAVKMTDGIAGNTADHPRDYRRAAGQIGALIKASIPTDAMAALAERERQAERRGYALAIAELESCGLAQSASALRSMEIAHEKIRAMNGGE